MVKTVAEVTLLISTGCASVELRYHETTLASTPTPPLILLGSGTKAASRHGTDLLQILKPAPQNRVNIKHTTIGPPDSTYRKEKS
jgi:hypothetical protein